MVEYQAAALDSLFHALADPTRRAMLRNLSDCTHTVSELAQPFRMSLAAASKHIKVLENAGLIHREVRGRAHVCALNARPLAEIRAWLSFYERFWTEPLHALDELLQKHKGADNERD